MAPSTVRRATALDAATIAELQLQVWQQAFSDVLPSEVVLADPTAHAASWEARLSQGGAVLLATEGSEPVGFAAVAADTRRRAAPRRDRGDLRGAAVGTARARRPAAGRRCR